MFHLVTTLFFFNDTATTEIYTLSLHDALPICAWADGDTLHIEAKGPQVHVMGFEIYVLAIVNERSEEHTSELQSHLNLVCRLLLEKKKNYSTHRISTL